MGKLWGQAVCTPCPALLFAGAYPKWSRGSVDRAGGTGTGRERRGCVLEPVRVPYPGVMVCLFCIMVCGYLESGILPKFSLCSDGTKWFQDKGQFKDGSYVPAAGDIIFFDWAMMARLTMWGLWRAWVKGM